jgi:transcriptional regulator with GAF, ATPase, and Fis domain
MSLSERERLWLSRTRSLCKLLIEANKRQELLRKVLDYAVEITEAERGFLVLVENRKPGTAYRIHVVESFGFDRELLQSASGEISRTIVGRVVETNKSVVSSRVEDATLMFASSIQARQKLSILCVPLCLRGELRGVLYLDHSTEKLFTARDLPILESYADQAALAIENLDLGYSRPDHVISQLSATGYGQIIGKSPVMLDMYRLIEAYARSWEHVIITGESGTGKELVARELHARGSHPREPFLAENSTAISESLFESELFGHAKGAFTGADRSRRGLFREAQCGTLFLDEISDMSLRMQAKLLRVLQERVVHPVGSNNVFPVECRVVAACQKNLMSLVNEGTFREDLFYRLDVLRIAVPPLRERPEDIPLLIDHIAGKSGVHLTFADRTLQLLKAWSWPGNVRELENELRRLSLNGSGKVAAKHLSPEIRAGGGVNPNLITANSHKLEDIERLMVEKALKDSGGNKARAAQQLGVPRANLYRMIKRYGL